MILIYTINQYGGVVKGIIGHEKVDNKKPA